MIPLPDVYGRGADENRARYKLLAETHRRRFGGDLPLRFFSAPGRTEIGGNHTDHNHGKVLAASIDRDSVAAVTPASGIHIVDITYNEEISLDPGGGFIPEKRDPKERSAALVMGIAAAFRKSGWKAGGFNAVISSAIPSASGVSSSAAFEMLVAFILNTLYNGGGISVEKLALAGQYAENVFWGKASGLLDQMSSGIGGFIALDFENPASPKIEKINFDFAAHGMVIALVNTGSAHAGLDEEYSSIAREMKSAAGVFGKETLAGIESGDLVRDLSRRAAEIRQNAGDRALLRAFHFAEENRRVETQIKALKKNELSAFLALVKESGDSSWKYLQNVYVPAAKDQGVAVALALTGIFIRREGLEGKAACRIHGGGFAGTIQFFVPSSSFGDYTQWMKESLGVEEKAVFKIAIRPFGVVEVAP